MFYVPTGQLNKDTKAISRCKPIHKCFFAKTLISPKKKKKAIVTIIQKMATVTVVQIEYECHFAFIFNDSGAKTHLALYCYYGILAGRTMGTMVNFSVFYYGEYMCRIRTKNT